MADYDFEAWAQSRVASSKPNPNQQAAASMRSAGIGGLGGKATTSSAQRIQDSFREMRENSRTSGSTNKSYFGDINTAGLGSPLSLKEAEKKDDRNLDQKIYDGMKAFGARLFPPRKESTSDYVLDVYETSPMFRIPTVPEVTEMGIEKSFEQKMQEMFSSQGQNVYTPEIEGTGSNDEVPATTDYQNLMRNRINSILKDVIAPNSKEYEIQKGDTLSDISLREGVSIDDLAKVNEIENPNMILAGGTLIIPEAQEMEKAKEYVLRVTTRGDENLVPDPERQFYQSGVPMDQRIFEPEAASYLDNQPQEREGLMSTDPITGFEGMGPDPSTGQGIMSPRRTGPNIDYEDPTEAPTDAQTEKDVFMGPIGSAIESKTNKFIDDIGTYAENNHGDTPVFTADAREANLPDDRKSLDIGYGHKIKRGSKEDTSGMIYGIKYKNADGSYIPLTEVQKRDILKKDYDKNTELALKKGWNRKLKEKGTSWDNLDYKYKNVLSSLAFNVGGRKAGEKWTQVLQAAKDKDAVAFARELRRMDAGEYTAGMDNRVMKELYYAGIIEKRGEVSSVLPEADFRSGVPR